jgi:dihydroorotate dehydrogenase
MELTFSMALDLYPFIRPLLFCFDPEKAHKLAIACLKRGLLPSAKIDPDPVLRTSVGAIDFSHPIGLAAGFDKQADAIKQSFDLGFSFIELGGVTPRPQPGNPGPRLFRIASAKAVINRFGFNSIGSDAFQRRLVAYLDTQKPSKSRVLGINLCKNKETEDAADDYVNGVLKFAGLADFLSVNVSSPNTPGLRDMQERGALTNLLNRVLAARASTGHKPRLYLKIAPDITEAQARDIAEVALATGIDGIIVGNTTISRPASIPAEIAKEAGGLSGKPLFKLSTKVLAQMYQLTQGKIPLIGCGGVFTGADAYAKIRAGASLVQIYTVMVFEGPMVLGRITTELAALLKRDGFTSVNEAVGADFRTTP